MSEENASGAPGATGLGETGGLVQRCLLVSSHKDTGTVRGGEKQAVGLARALRKRGWDVRMAVAPSTAVHRAAEEVGIPCYPLRVRPEYAPWAFWRLHRIARSFGAGVLHLNDAHAISLGVYARYARTAPLVVGHRHMAKRPRHVLSYRLGTDGVIAISEAARQSLVAAGYPMERTVVAPAYVDPMFLNPPSLDRMSARRRWGLSEEAFVYLVVASLDRGKGHHTLLEAFAHMHDATETCLMIVGDGPLRSDLETLANQRNLGSRVCFTGALRGETLLAAYALADVFVYGSHHEGLGLVLLEAQAMGLPIVAARAPGVTEAVQEGKTALLCEAGDAIGMAALMDQLRRDASLRRRLSVAGMRWVRERFTEEHVVRSVLEAYQGFFRRRSEAGSSRKGPSWADAR